MQPLKKNTNFYDYVKEKRHKENKKITKLLLFFVLLIAIIRLKK